MPVRLSKEKLEIDGGWEITWKKRNMFSRAGPRAIGDY